MNRYGFMIEWHLLSHFAWTDAEFEKATGFRLCQNTNQNQMKNKCLFFIVFQVLKVLLMKICKMQPIDLLFLVVFISFYISRIAFHKFLELYSTFISQKKVLITNFPFLADSLNPDQTENIALSNVVKTDINVCIFNICLISIR